MRDDAGVDDVVRIEVGAAAAAAARARVWRREVPRIFDGLRVRAGASFAPATLAIARCGAGRVAMLDGGAHGIERTVAGRDASSGLLNVLLQTRGESSFAQGGRRGELARGEIVLIDGAQNFHLELGEDYAQVLVQLPRDLVARRHDGLLRRIGERIPASDPGGQLLADTVGILAARLERLSPERRAHALEAIVGLLGVIVPERGASAPARRFARAMTDIDANLSDPDLSGALLASLQGVSRRRLESIFAQHGKTIEEVIWTRRLERAALDLENRALAHRRIVDIALRWGFSSQAHFSRRFRSRFGESPRVHRRRAESVAPR
jgi:AraC-like DNA-binding protein